MGMNLLCTSTHVGSSYVSSKEVCCAPCSSSSSSTTWTAQWNSWWNFFESLLSIQNWVTLWCQTRTELPCRQRSVVALVALVTAVVVKVKLELSVVTAAMAVMTAAAKKSVKCVSWRPRRWIHRLAARVVVMALVDLGMAVMASVTAAVGS